MKRLHVYNGNSLIRAIDADTVNLSPSTGTLSFYHTEGQRPYARLSAAFVSGSFTHFITIGDIGCPTTSSNSSPAETPSSPQYLTPQEEAWGIGSVTSLPQS